MKRMMNQTSPGGIQYFQPYHGGGDVYLLQVIIKSVRVWQKKVCFKKFIYKWRHVFGQFSPPCPIVTLMLSFAVTKSLIPSYFTKTETSFVNDFYGEHIRDEQINIKLHWKCIWSSSYLTPISTSILQLFFLFNINCNSIWKISEDLGMSRKGIKYFYLEKKNNV